MAVAPSASYSFTVRLEIRNKPGIPSVFNKKVAPLVAHEVFKAAQKTGVARRRHRSDSTVRS